MKRKKKIAIVGSITVFTFALILVVGVSIGYYLFTARTGIETPSDATVQVSPTSAEPTILPEIFGSGSSTTGANAVGVVDIFLRLFLSVLLASILAFRPRRDVPLFQRNLYVAQTQILLAVVAAALMMIVGDNTARAFAIFAAVSLVRFRTNIRDPKEITVLLISLALGLAAGVGKWELGIVLCLFALALLSLLEYNEPEQVYRSMELTVKTKDTEMTQKLLKKFFNRFKLESEIREIEPTEDDGNRGIIVYHVNLPLNLSTDYLSEIILSSASDLVESIEWKQKKNRSYVYQ